MIIDFITHCPMCGRQSVITLDYSKFARWQAGEHVQNVFPEFSTTQRETLVSGMCSTCQSKLFDVEDDEEGT